MISHEVYGERFARILLETIFGRPFGELTLVGQKPYYGGDTEHKSIILDVYIEEKINTDPVLEAVREGSQKNARESRQEESAITVYDIEPDQIRSQVRDDLLAKRLRYYYSLMDARSLASGRSYDRLRNVYIIMIATYDPLGDDRMIYTIRNLCEEDPTLRYEDGARTVLLYTKGKKGRTGKKLPELLRYLEDTRRERAVNESLREIQRMVDAVKGIAKSEEQYMKSWDYEMLIRLDAKEEGLEEGRAEERQATERERARAERAEQENARLKALLASMQGKS